MACSETDNNKRRWIKYDPEDIFQVTVCAYSNGLDKELEEIYSSDLDQPDDKLSNLISMVKMIFRLSQLDPLDYWSVDNNFENGNVVFSYKQVPMCPTTTLKSLLDNCKERVLNFVIFTEQQWNEFLEKPKQQSQQEIEPETPADHQQPVVFHENPVCFDSSPSLLSIDVKSAAGKSFLFESMSIDTSIKEFYNKLKESPIFDENFKLRFDGDTLTATSEETFKSLGIEDGDSIDYF